ncbi:hypothetical protein [Streptomyces gobiensis]|uniref:hypothetical protein n=1 Tax=Streptomyces gobiensis TaxID=2875706 RepID=UPI001E59E8D6|nr:hypothetical protein [Streptomyces gobiensis]UGY93257.1 hypothetical protein test1122_17065 [Streptomyces gobiensis]
MGLRYPQDPPIPRVRHILVSLLFWQERYESAVEQLCHQQPCLAGPRIPEESPGSQGP